MYLLLNEKKDHFDPDKLVLSKNDILEFCDNVLQNWSKDPKKTPQQVLAMNAVRTSIFFTDEDSLKSIWSEILKWTNHLMYENAIAQGDIDHNKWSNTMKKVKKMPKKNRKNEHKYP